MIKRTKTNNIPTYTFIRIWENWRIFIKFNEHIKMHFRVVLVFRRILCSANFFSNAQRFIKVQPLSSLVNLYNKEHIWWEEKSRKCGNKSLYEYISLGRNFTSQKVQELEQYYLWVVFIEKGFVIKERSH